MFEIIVSLVANSSRRCSVLSLMICHYVAFFLQGSQYGTPKGGQTVVVDIRHMNPEWTEVFRSSKEVHQSTVADYVAAGGTSYTWYSYEDNCYGAADRMMALL